MLGHQYHRWARLAEHEAASRVDLGEAPARARYGTFLLLPSRHTSIIAADVRPCPTVAGRFILNGAGFPDRSRIG